MAIRSKTWLSDFHAPYSWPEIGKPAVPPLARRSVIVTSRSASGKGSGFRKTALKRQKTADVPPMPSAIERIATAVKPGVRVSVRAA